MDFFGSLADRYDSLRAEDPPYLPTISGLIRRFGNRCILDLGCGTGKIAEKVLQVADINLIGIDISPQMLYKFVSKNTKAKLICASVENLPILNNVADGIICIYLIHLLKNPEVVLKEFRRVLNKGWIVIVSAPHHYIKVHPLNMFFPSFSRIDLARFPTEDSMVSWLRNAGFSSIEMQYCSVFRKWYTREYFEKVKNKFISTLSLLPENEFNEGLKLMEEFIKRGENVDSLPWESVVITGFV